MTEREHRFLDYYLKDPNATKAVLAAGYAEKSARQTANRMLSKPHIKEELEKRREALQEAAGLDAVEILKGVARIAEEAPRERDKLRAYELLGKRLDLWGKKEAKFDLRTAAVVTVCLSDEKIIEAEEVAGD